MYTDTWKVSPVRRGRHEKARHQLSVPQNFTRDFFVRDTVHHARCAQNNLLFFSRVILAHLARGYAAVTLFRLSEPQIRAYALSSLDHGDTLFLNTSRLSIFTFAFSSGRGERKLFPPSPLRGFSSLIERSTGFCVTIDD